MSNDLTDKLADKKNELQNKPVSKIVQVKNYFEKMKGEIAKALPEHMNPDRMLKLMTSTVRNNPKLLECTMSSLAGAAMTAAQLGLEPDMLGMCYFVPYGKSCQFIIGYQGLIELFYRSGKVKKIFGSAVHENDEFDYLRGTEDKLVHRPLIKGDRGAIIGYYSIAFLEGCDPIYIYMSREEIIKHRDRFSKAKNYGPWKDNFDAMAIKTTVRQLAKWLPKSVEMVQAQRLDNTVRHGVKEEDLFDVEGEAEQVAAEQEQPEDEPAKEELFEDNPPANDKAEGVKKAAIINTCKSFLKANPKEWEAMQKKHSFKDIDKVALPRLKAIKKDIDEFLGF